MRGFKKTDTSEPRWNDEPTEVEHNLKRAQRERAA